MIHPIVKEAFGGLVRAGLAEAIEFVFRDFRKKPGAQLSRIIKAVTKKFNSWDNPESKFTEDDLTKAYIADHVDAVIKPGGTASPEEARKMRANSYGLDTLGPPYSHWIEKIIQTGSIPPEVQGLKKVR